ncbi:MAG TPA: T9SS type A sorting domain-containing protein, partial [Bacteroidetes bacterium]|nr:T9SS type A sorting domain-containing protein [Bacteroidota bacterium]
MKKSIILSIYLSILSLSLFAIKNPKQPNVKNSKNVSYIPWIKNTGQFNDNIAFSSKTFAGNVFVKNNRSIGYQIMSADKSMVFLEEAFLNSTKPDFKPKGLDQTTTEVNYFIGKKEDHHTNIPTYKIIDLGEVWKGIDVQLKATNKNYEKIFILNPMSDPGQINIEIKGAQDICKTGDGELQIDLSDRDICFTKPKAWQDINGKKIEVNVTYKIILKDNIYSYGFVLGTYDPEYSLYIDPLLASTYFGGNYYDDLIFLVVDKNDKVYAAGITNSDTFPVSPEAFDTSYNDIKNYDIFIARFSKDLDSLEVCTYLGGSKKDVVSGLVMDTLGNVYISGITHSTDYPATANAYDNTFNGDEFVQYAIVKLGDVIISKFDSNLSILKASTFIGGEKGEGSYGMAINKDQEIYITGISSGTGIPKVGPQFHQINYQGTFFLKIDNNLSNILASNSLGIHTGLYDGPTDICVDTSGNILVTGTTTFLDTFPVTPGCYDNSFNGGSIDGFIMKLSPDLSQNLASTYFGSPGKEDIAGITVDSSNNIFITGYTDSDTFPVTNNAYDTTYNGKFSLYGGDAYIAKFNNNLSTLLASTYLGGKYDDYGWKIIVDDKNDVFVYGVTGSSDFPLFCNSIRYGNTGAFITLFDPMLSDLKASSILGVSPENIFPGALKQNNDKDLIICGNTSSENLPVINPYDSTYNGGYSDGFIAKLTPDLINYSPCCTYLKYPMYRQDSVPANVELRWDIALGATGYYLSIGTVDDQYSILNNMDVGNELSYFVNDLPCEDSIYVTITAYNDVAIAMGPYCWTSHFYTVKTPEMVMIYLSICDGDSVEIEGNIYTESGIYEIVTEAKNGCDSIIELTLDVNSGSFISDSIFICEGDSVLWFGQYYHEEGKYYQNYSNIYGCDSIYELVLNINPNYESMSVKEICPYDTLIWENQKIFSEGIYTANYQSMNGCDSILNLEVIVLPEYFYYDTMNICDGDTLEWQGEYYYTQGNYEKLFQTVKECDSIYYLNLNVNSSYNFEEEISVCEGDSLEWQGMILSEPGEYFAEYNTISDCDSIYKLLLTKIEIDTSITISGDSLIAVEDENASYQWLKCPGFEMIDNATQAIYSAIQSGSYAVEITKGACIDTSSCIELVHSRLNEIENPIDYNIFPNPVFNKHFTIHPSNIDEIYSIEIIDINGKCVIKLDELFGIQKIETHSLKSGVYI